MKPLNLSGVLWLSGTAQEIEQFIRDAEGKHRAILVGHKENIRSQLVRIARWDNLEGLQGFIVRTGKEDSVEAAFLLVQGQVIGLLVDPAKPEDRRGGSD